jgi:hypothetical protein
MKENIEITEVIFRIFKDKQVIALFPYIIEHEYDILSYMIIGQHSKADYDYIMRQTKLAKESEYNDIKNELENEFGYNLKVISKMNKKKYEKCLNNLLVSK